MSEGELSQLKEWLTNEVKLHRYFEKLVNYGFSSIDLIKDLTENDLDAIGIVPPYHRNRLLKFCQGLKQDDIEHEQESNVVSLTGSKLIETNQQIVNTHNDNDNEVTIEPDEPDPEDLDDFAPPPLPPKISVPKAPAPPNRESSLPRVPEVSLLTGIAYNPQNGAPSMTQHVKKQPPPPIPPRADLTEENGQSVPHETINENLLTGTTAIDKEKNDQITVCTTSKTEDQTEEVPSVVACRDGEIAPPKPRPKPRRIGSSNKSQQALSTAEVNDDNNSSQTSQQQMELQPKAMTIKPRPRPRPAPPARPVSFAVQPKHVESESSSNNTQKGGSLNRYPTPSAPEDVANDNLVQLQPIGTYEEVHRAPQPANPPPEESIYESIETDQKPASETSTQQVFDVVQMRKPIKPQGQFKGLLDNHSKVRVSMYGLIDCDFESDESEEDLLVADPPLKARSESVSSTTEGRPMSVLPATKSRKTSGYLYKQGGQQNNKGWRKRWFVFDGKFLRYYRNEENTSESLHIIPVSQMVKIDYDHNKENSRARFHLVTTNRVFMLASDNMTDTNLWAQTLMEAIIQSKSDGIDKKPGGDMMEPDKEGWLKKQGHNVMGDWKKRYVAIKAEKICYYDTYDDFVHETPIHCIMGQLATVKTDHHRSRFQIITPNKAFSFQAENEFEAASWISAIQTAIQMGLSDHSIINKVWDSNPTNRRCADCGKKDPVWAAVNYCICVCARCIGIHRNLGVKFSKPRSLLMDERIWNDQLIELMIKIGNSNANTLLEHKLPEDDRITPESDSEKRIEFIYAKYKDKRYSKISQDYGDPEALGQALREAVVTDDVMTTMQLLINKVDVKYVPADCSDERTPYKIAKDAGQELQVELLYHNGGDAPSEEPRSTQDEESTIPSIEISSPPPIEVPEKSGFLTMRKRLWFTLKDRNLKYYRGNGDKEPLGVIDLKLVTSLELQNNDDNRSLDIITAEKTYTLKGDTDEELDSWYIAIKNKQVFNVHLSYQELGSDGIPHIVAKCLQFVETYGLQAEGVYRVNGSQAKMRVLAQLFNQDASRVMLTLDDYSVHDITGTLKRYLRDLPEPVFPDDMYRTFITISQNPDHNSKLMDMKDALARLPKVNYDTLKRIIGHLTKVTADQPVNRMGIENVSMIFGSTLMSNENTGQMDDKSINQEFTIIGEMIHYYQWLFDVDEEEIEKDKRMNDALKKITKLIDGNTGPTNEEFTLDIKVVEKDDNPCLLKVSSAMTAGELCMNVVAQKGLQTEGNWALFEVVEKLDIERALQFREKVLPAVMSWDVFGENGKNNYLIVKENHIQESIQPFVGNTLALEGQLHVREPKRKDWRLSTIVLKNGKMVMDKSKSFFKSIKSDKSDADQWSLHNLFVYVGVPSEKPQKGIDISAGFTVVVKTEPDMCSMIRYICAKDRTELFRWVAAILNMKHPEGLWNDPTTKLRVKDRQVYLGRQSHLLRREGSSKHIVEEIRSRRKSLRRSNDRPT